MFLLVGWNSTLTGHAMFYLVTQLLQLRFRSHTPSLDLWFLVTQSSSNSMWEEPAQGCEYQEVQVLGGRLGGWLRHQGCDLSPKVFSKDPLHFLIFPPKGSVIFRRLLQCYSIKAQNQNKESNFPWRKGKVNNVCLFEATSSTSDINVCICVWLSYLFKITAVPTYAKGFQTAVLLFLYSIYSFSWQLWVF